MAALHDGFGVLVERSGSLNGEEGFTRRANTARKCPYYALKPVGTAVDTPKGDRQDAGSLARIRGGGWGQS